MVRRKAGRATHEEAQRIMDWNLSSDASIEGISDWDVKTAQLAEAILCILATGSAIMFGTTMSGGAISLTIYSGEDKVRTYATDSVELDDWSDAIIGKARKFIAAGIRNEPTSKKEQGEAAS